MTIDVGVHSQQRIAAGELGAFRSEMLRLEEKWSAFGV
jgi:hypothetical protein